MTKARLFFIFSLSFISGIAFSSFYYPRVIENYLLLIFLSLALGWLFSFYQKPLALVVGLSWLCLLLGIYITNHQLQIIKTLPVEPLAYSGIIRIIGEPKIKNGYQNIKAKPEDKNYSLLVNTRSYDTFQPGDRLRVSCAMELPENFSDFDYRMYLAKEGIYYLCQPAKMEKEKSDFGIYTKLLAAKKTLSKNIAQSMPSPQSGLLIGLLLGGDDNLPKSIQDEFSRTGLSHIVAVSGYNVTIIAEYLMLIGIALGLWRKQAFWFAAAGIAIFVLLIGYPSSAVRAGIMGTLLLWAMKNGRLGNAQNAILLSASLMLLLNPLLLRWDIGFQLSFLATLGIVYVYPLFQNYLLKRLSKSSVHIGALLEMLFLTLAAQVFVLPVIMYYFGSLSLISPIANVVILPIVPLTMLLGFFMILFGLVFPPLATILAWITFLPLKLETLMIHFFSQLPYSSVEVGFPWWGILAWYIIIVLALAYRHKKNDSLDNSVG